MNTNFRTKLTLPGKMDFLPLALAYVRELATLAKLTHREIKFMVLAVEEACANAIKYAYDSIEAGDITVVGELSPTALKIVIHDRGLPFDQSLAPAYTPPADKDILHASIRGLGLYLIQQAVDEVHWQNKGREGKELHLVKYCRQPGMIPVLSEADADICTVPECQTPHPRITIRRMIPEDALRVAQCFYRTFGYTYEDDLYVPDHLIRLNQTGEFISVVAVDEETGEVVGHDALVREGLKPVGEYTHLVVAPAYRGQRIRQRMGDFLEQELHQLDVIGLFGQAVTAHTISQRASESRGFHVCGISLAMDSPYVFKKIRFAPQIKESSAEADARPPHRESLVFYFKYLVPPPDTMVYAPRRHSEMLAGIYANLQVQADFREAAPVGGQGQLSVRLSGEDKLGEIEVEKVGADTATEIRRAWRDLCDIGGAEVVYLYLPLSDPGTPDACRSAEDHGFFFSGVWPAHAAHGDYLRLQYLAVQLDPAYIQVFSPFGRELLSYVLQEQQRNSAHRGST